MTGPHVDGPAMLFNLDGTLIDSVYQHVLAWQEALTGVGIELSVGRLHRRIGMSGGIVYYRSCASPAVTCRPTRYSPASPVRRWPANSSPGLATTVIELDLQLAELDKLIADRFQSHRHAKVIASMVGIGDLSPLDNRIENQATTTTISIPMQQPRRRPRT
jgi:hypothetical protein